MLMNRTDAQAVRCPMTGFNRCCEGHKCVAWRWFDATHESYLTLILPSHAETGFLRSLPAFLVRRMRGLIGESSSEVEHFLSLTDGEDGGHLNPGSTFPSGPGWELSKVQAEWNSVIVTLTFHRRIEWSDRRGYCGVGGKPEHPA